MTLESILAFLREHKTQLHDEFGVEKVGVFGSYARHSATQKSDIDFFVVFSKKSFRNLTRLYDFFEKAFGTKVDIVTEHKAMRPSLRREIQEHIVYG